MINIHITIKDNLLNVLKWAICYILKTPGTGLHRLKKREQRIF